MKQAFKHFRRNRWKRNRALVFNKLLSTFFVNWNNFGFFSFQRKLNIKQTCFKNNVKGSVNWNTVRFALISGNDYSGNVIFVNWRKDNVLSVRNGSSEGKALPFEIEELWSTKKVLKIPLFHKSKKYKWLQLDSNPQPLSS